MQEIAGVYVGADNARLRNDFEECRVHQTRITQQSSLPAITRLPGGEVLQTMKSHYIPEGRMMRALHVNSV